MGNFLHNNQDEEASLKNRQLIPPILFKNKIYIISNPKLFLVLYKIGKLSNFMIFAELCGYDETKKWLKGQNLLNEPFLQNVSLYSLACRIKHAAKIRFYTKDPKRSVSKYDLN